MAKTKLKSGTEVWYINHQNEVVKGQVFGVHYNQHGTLRSVTFSVPNDFVGLAAEYIGKKLFMTEEEAYAHL